MNTRAIPSTGEHLPLIGLGTWQTFDVGTGPGERGPLGDVLRAFSADGGRLIDSSPMYGNAERVVGDLVENVRDRFIATKVWTHGRAKGIEQMERSAHLLRTPVIDLMQIHNLLDWRTHLATLRGWKSEGRIRYLGITHYHAGAFSDLASIMRSEAIDFVQLPMSIELPEAERELLPLAAARGIAVLVNRPFEGGTLFRNVRNLPLPPWAQDFDCASWGEIFLRYVVSHPAVTCAIPATRNRDHLEANMRAGQGRALTPGERRKLRELALAVI
jgi:diketogulonate reductase-like aldo/keto reductase